MLCFSGLRLTSPLLTPYAKEQLVGADDYMLLTLRLTVRIAVAWNFLITVATAGRSGTLLAVRTFSKNRERGREKRRISIEEEKGAQTSFHNKK